MSLERAKKTERPKKKKRGGAWSLEIQSRRKLTYTFVEAAREIGCSSKTVSRMVAARTLKTVVVGQSKRIPVSELERLARGGR